MKDRKCAQHTNRQATDETDTWLVSFLENLRRVEHWVLVRAPDCQSAIQAARLKLRHQLMNPLGSLDFKQCIRTGEDAGLNPFRPSTNLDVNRPGAQPVHLTKEVVQGFELNAPVHGLSTEQVKFTVTDDQDSHRASRPTVH